MKICFIADSSSVHTQRIVSHSVIKGDNILVVSSALHPFNIAGTKTIHLLESERPLFFGGQSDNEAKGLKARIKAVVPLEIKMMGIQIIRAGRLLSRRGLCAGEIGHFDPDVIYCFRSFPEGVLASYCHFWPLLLRTAGPDISKLPRYPVFRQLIRRALRTADLVITESIWEKELLRKLCGSAVSPEVGILGVNTALFQPPRSRENLRDKYAIPRDAFVVVTNRSLEGHYNGWLIVEAVESVLDECPNLVLFYASPSKMGFRSKARSEATMARWPQITFLDRRVPHHEVPAILGCADVYISLSAYDGIPNSVLEAMACGIVPIVADLPQLHEWIEDGKSGYFVPQGDVKSVAALIRNLYKNRGTLRGMARRCVEKIRKTGSQEVAMERTRDLLSRLCRRRNPSNNCVSRFVAPSKHRASLLAILSYLKGQHRMNNGRDAGASSGGDKS